MRKKKVEYEDREQMSGRLGMGVVILDRVDWEGFLNEGDI